MTAIKVTKAMDEAAWLQERSKGIGGTDVACLLGLSPYKTPLQLWEEKTGRTVAEKAGEAAYWGTMLEDVVAKEFARRTGMQIQKVNSMLTTGEDGWMRGNIDRAVINPKIAKRVSVHKAEKAAETGLMLSTDVGLECKTTSAFGADKWGPSQEAEIRAGAVVTEHKIPLYYETQIQWYMAITGMKTFYVAVLIGGQDFRIYEVKRDEDVINALVEKAAAFWDLVKTDTPPAAINAEDIKRLYSKDNGELAEATNAEAADIGELRTIKERIKELKDQEALIADRLILSIGERAGLTIGGEKAATYKTQTANRFSTTAFKKEHKDLYEEYVTSSTTRVLRIS